MMMTTTTMMTITMAGKIFRRAATFLTVLLVGIQVFAVDYEAQPLEYFKEKRKNDYSFAMSTAKDIYGYLKKQEYPYAIEAVSIVFPEMMRYSAFQNEIESLINEVLAFTSDESNGFSIGLFQMKPLFASAVEKLVRADPELRKKYPTIDYNGIAADTGSRRDRIMRLRKLDFQLEYLKAFIDYEVKILNLQNEKQDDRIKYLSAAYNYGIQTSREKLENVFTWKSFPSGKRNLYFNYQKICLAVAEELLQ